MITVVISSIVLIVAWLANAAFALQYGFFFLAAVVAFERAMQALTGRAMSVAFEYQRFLNERHH